MSQELAPCQLGTCEYTQGNPGYEMLGMVGGTCLELLRQLEDDDLGGELNIQPGDCPYAILQAQAEANIARREGEL